MKGLHWLGAAFVVYSGVVGIAELATGSSAGGGNATLTSISQAPSLGSMVISSTGGSITSSGFVDLAIAVGVYIFVLHDKLF